MTSSSPNECPDNSTDRLTAVPQSSNLGRPKALSDHSRPKGNNIFSQRCADQHRDIAKKSPIADFGDLSRVRVVARPGQRLGALNQQYR